MSKEEKKPPKKIMKGVERKVLGLARAHLTTSKLLILLTLTRGRGGAKNAHGVSKKCNAIQCKKI